MVIFNRRKFLHNVFELQPMSNPASPWAASIFQAVNGRFRCSNFDADPAQRGAWWARVFLLHHETPPSSC